MKTLKILLLIIMSAFMLPANAQILKKIQNRVAEKVERSIIEKTSNKAERTSDKVLDGVLDPSTGKKRNNSNTNKATKSQDSPDQEEYNESNEYTDMAENMKKYEGLFGGGDMGMIDLAKLPKQYIFDYEYKVKSTSGKNAVNFTYLFSKNSSAMGLRMEHGFMIIDTENQAMIQETNGKFTAIKMFDTSGFGDFDEEDEDIDFSDIKITNLPNKTFLGYNCIGRLMENDKMQMKMYVAPQIDVNFTNMFSESTSQMPKSMKENIHNIPTGLMMYVQYMDKTSNKKKNEMTMECIQFDEKRITVNIRK
ncbi:MAG: hypothetical protein Q4G27_01175 [Flavobacteriaceae bacterium]|nr:hypothetical protein [Flavobacteriaceae bacterium]